MVRPARARSRHRTRGPLTHTRAPELYPAGPFPNQNLDEGVAFMASKRDASLDAEDIVLW